MNKYLSVFILGFELCSCNYNCSYLKFCFICLFFLDVCLEGGWCDGRIFFLCLLGTYNRFNGF